MDVKKLIQRIGSYMIPILFVALVYLAFDLIPKQYLEMRANILAAYSFDGILTCTVPETEQHSMETSEAIYASSRFDRALRLKEGRTVKLSLPKMWNLAETGMISFWLRPSGDPAIQEFQQIMMIPEASFSLHHDGPGQLVFRIGTKVATISAGWVPGHWNHIAIGWARKSDQTEGYMELHLNGRKAQCVFGPGTGRFPAQLENSTLIIGQLGESGFQGDIDELVVFNRLLQDREVRSIFGFNLSARDLERVKDLLLAEPLINLAAGKPVTGSQPELNRKYGYERVTDGDTYTEYHASNAPNMRGRQWVQVDLGQVQKINEIHLWHASGGVYPSNIVEVSTDSDFHGEQTVVFDSEKESPYFEEPGGRTFRFPAVKARYIRNTIQGDSRDGKNRWLELKAFFDPFPYPPTIQMEMAELPVEPNFIDSEKDVIHYVPPVFEYVDKSSLPQVEWIDKPVYAFGSPDEYVPRTFVVRSRMAFRNVRVTAGIPTDDEGNGLDSLNLHVVKAHNYTRTSKQKFAEKDKTAPELLLKDDRVPLKEVMRTTGDFPEVRMNGDVFTNLEARQSKQFWITCKIPRKAKAGLYRTTIRLTSPNGLWMAIPFEVNVLPISLAKPLNRFWGIHFPLRLSEKPRSKLSLEKRKSQHPYFGKNTLKRYLLDAREHGFDVLALLADPFTGPDSDAAKTVLLARDSGFDRGIMPILDPWVNSSDSWDSIEDRKLPEYLKMLGKFQEEHDLPILALYQEDEPHTLRHAREMDKRRPVILENGSYTITSINGGHLHPFVERVDYPVIQPSSPFGARWAAQALRERKKSPWYYYQTWSMNPETARKNTGYSFWYMNFDGVLPYTYMRIFNDPYNDIDGPFKDFCMSFPTKRGPINTRLFEAAREGVDDFRYLNTFLTVMKKLNVELRHDPESLSKMETVMDRVWNTVRRQVFQAEDADYETDRRAIADAILSLQALRGQPTTSPEAESLESTPPEAESPEPATTEITPQEEATSQE